MQLPREIANDVGAAMMLRGMTAYVLLRRVYSLRPGDAALVYAAAGGTGLLVSQWARALGATVIGVVSTDDKAAIAREHGCAHVIVSSREETASRGRRHYERSQGRGGLRLGR